MQSPPTSGEIGADPECNCSPDDVAYLLVSVPKNGKGGEEIHEIFFSEGDRNSARERAYNVRDEFARECGDFFWEVEAVESGDTFEVEELEE